MRHLSIILIVALLSIATGCQQTPKVSAPDPALGVAGGSDGPPVVRPGIPGGTALPGPGGPASGKPDLGRPGLKVPDLAAPDLGGTWQGLLVLGGRVFGTLEVTFPAGAGGSSSGPMLLRALGLRTDFDSRRPARPDLSVQVAPGNSVSIPAAALAMGSGPGKTAAVTFEGRGRYAAKVPDESLPIDRPVMVGSGTLVFRQDQVGDRFGGQDMGSYFAGRKLADAFVTMGLGRGFGGQDMGDYFRRNFGGQDMGSYFGGQDMGSYFGGQDMGDYFGGQDMGSYLTSHAGTLRFGLVLVKGAPASIPLPK
ncbi:MAG: hypothetical protein MUE73_06930 [Planctomycetes bacterium]|jgi:hypothetical protein|nr:hypothetical protein [Planctomycetota bacterium]